MDGKPIMINMRKKLFRGGGYIGGVWRVAFIFIIPAAFWVYVILWIFLPKKY